MTHFSVVIITKEQPDGDLIENLMAPYKEYDGEDGRFLRDVDITEETREQYATRTERRYKAPDGTLHDPWTDEFYRDPTAEEEAKHGPFHGFGVGGGISWNSKDWNDGKGYRGKIQFVPDGWTEVNIPTSELMSFPDFIRDYHEYESITEWAQPDYDDEHAHGYFVINDAGEVTKVFRRYNPEGHWDWYEIGGRWSGELRVIDPSLGYPAQDHWTGKSPENGFDVSRRDNLDIDAMRSAVSGQRRKWFNDIAGRAGVELATLERMLHLYRDIHQKWLALDPRPRGNDYRDWLIANVEEGETLHKVINATFDTPELKEGQTIEAYIADVVPLSAHAMIIDGKWMQRGKMGWWASMHNEAMSHEEWTATVWKTIEQTPGDHWISVVDCHV